MNQKYQKKNLDSLGKAGPTRRGSGDVVRVAGRAVSRQLT